MRRFTALLLTSLLALSLALPTWTDSLWYPENDFADAHYRDCDFTVRHGFANSPKGCIDGLDQPDGRVIYQTENGSKVTVYATYQDWGCIGCPEEGAEPSDNWRDNEARGAWVPLSDLALTYDHLSFQKEFADQLVPGDQAAVDTLLAAREDDTIVLWPYPNAAEAEWAGANGDWAYDSIEVYGFDYTYTDPEGLLWGTCYLHGFQDVWVCLSAPAAGDGHTELYRQTDQTYVPNPNPRLASVRALPEVTVYPPQEPVPPAESHLPALLVLLTVLLSAAALWFFYGKKHNKGGTT